MPMLDRDRELLEHATAIVAKGESALPSDLKHGFYWIWSGHMTKAWVYYKNNDGRFAEVIASLIRRTIEIHGQYNMALGLESQIELVFLALLTRDLAGARRLAAFPVKYEHSHPFDKTLSRLLLAALGIESSIPPVRYTPTKSELGFFKDLECVAVRKPTDFQGTNKYWTATKGKRYANSIFAPKNIFRVALENAQGI